jgi:hypothetical protein
MDEAAKVLVSFRSPDTPTSCSVSEKAKAAGGMDIDMEDGAEQDAAEDHGDGTRVFYGSRPFF